MGKAQRKQMYVEEWAESMTGRYGKWACERHFFTWTEALYMEVYDQFPDDKPIPITKAMLDRAIAWELGDWPEWVKR